ncbi:hypothetical protein QBC47DRAFT_386276 [Echria macrotheca]|uniref:Uncharacterized protein n=1 Tax=Echria macrotheca TaxID=438768 RepID=A0AAJ0F3F0_9PEZI|nr:hypothetical protein QBC47DRAFT_386276 [Echria macrotheca]
MSLPHTGMEPISVFFAALLVAIILLVYRQAPRQNAVTAVRLASEKWGLSMDKRRDEELADRGTHDATEVMPEIKPLPDFRWETTEPARLRPFKPTYHITMALQGSTPSELIVMDRNYRDRVLSRRDIIVQHERCVLGCTHKGEAAVNELYSYLVDDYLPVRYPSMFELQLAQDKESSIFLNKVTGLKLPRRAPADAVQSLKFLGETVEDDMFLLLQREPQSCEAGEHETVAYVCCHPSGFDPSKKLGKLLRDVHRPVPAYAKIGPSMEKYFSRLQVGKSAKRVNWSIQTHTNLFAPSGNHVHEDDEVHEEDDVDITKTMFRVELQTLTRLPRTRAILFSFKTYLYPIAEIRAEGLGPQLADAIEGLKTGNAPGMWTYKGGVRWGKAVCRFLRS